VLSTASSLEACCGNIKLIPSTTRDVVTLTQNQIYAMASYFAERFPDSPVPIVSTVYNRGKDHHRAWLIALAASNGTEMIAHLGRCLSAVDMLDHELQERCSLLIKASKKNEARGDYVRVFGLAAAICIVVGGFAISTWSSSTQTVQMVSHVMYVQAPGKPG
jgi:hypothetical protein